MSHPGTRHPPGQGTRIQVELPETEREEYDPTHGLVESALSVPADREEIISTISERVIGTGEVLG